MNAPTAEPLSKLGADCKKVLLIPWDSGLAIWEGEHQYSIVQDYTVFHGTESYSGNITVNNL